MDSREQGEGEIKSLPRYVVDASVIAKWVLSRGGQPMKTSLWVRKRKINDLIELILVRGHVEQL